VVAYEIQLRKGSALAGWMQQPVVAATADQPSSIITLNRIDVPLGEHHRGGENVTLSCGCLDSGNLGIPASQDWFKGSTATYGTGAYSQN